MGVSLVNSNYDVNYLTQTLGLSSTSTSTTSYTLSGTSSDDSDTDTVSISAAGSASSQLVSLVQQRQSILESKEALVNSTLENGGSTDSIQSQLDEYDSQLAEIDSQIAEATAQASSQQTQNILTYSKESIKNNASAQTSRLDSIVGLRSSLGQTQAAASAKNRVDRQAKTLSSEIDADQSRGIDTSDKESELDELETQSTSIASSLTAGLNNINQEIIENNGDPLVEVDYPTGMTAATYKALTAETEEDTETTTTEETE